MARIFVSYRRSDTEAVTGRIFDRLQSHFGEGNVVIDIDSFPFGHDFRKAIADEINACDAVIAIIGRQWAHEGGRWRLNEDNDFVRIEIESALARDVPLVPVLVDGAVMPSSTELPETIRGLAFRNAANVDLGRDFHVHLDRIIRSLDRSLGTGDAESGTDEAQPAPLSLTSAARTATRPIIAPDEPIELPVEPARTGRRSLAERLEHFSEQHETVNFTVFALVGGFLLCMASALADLHLVTQLQQGAEKEVGFLYAPNWVITYLILLPLYLMLFSILIRKRTKLLKLFAQARAIVGADGKAVGEGALLAHWNKSLARVSQVLWAFILVVVLQSGQEWAKSCLMPLLNRDTSNRVVDWSIVAATRADPVWIWKSILFTGFAYAYMGFALFIYLAVMLYGVALSSFVNRVTETADDIRMTRLSPPLLRELSESAIAIWACAFLGLCAAYVMRLQAGYVVSSYPNVLVFMFSHDALPMLAHLGLIGPEAARRLDGAGINSEWTSLLVAAYAIAMFSMSMFLLHRGLKSAAGEEGETDRRRASGLGLILPRFRHLIIALVLAALSCIFVGAGLLFLAALAYAAWALTASTAAAKQAPQPTARAEGA